MGLVFGQGFATSLALIVAIGAQNAYLLRQGIRRQHVLPLVLFCALSDASLIAAGIGGMGTLLREHPAWLQTTRHGGALFLLGYGLLAARRAWHGEQMHIGDARASSLANALATCAAFTFLNPHVYLDTVVLLGSLANQHPDAQRWWFGAGAMTASLCWFVALGLGARWLTPLFQTRSAWRVLDSLIALTMGLLAALLLVS